MEEKRPWQVWADASGAVYSEVVCVVCGNGEEEMRYDVWRIEVKDCGNAMVVKSVNKDAN
jgi:hypothetical protein